MEIQQTKVSDYPIDHKTTFGDSYKSKIDGQRIKQQHESIKKLMLDGVWRTLYEVENLTSFPQASISAQLRHLRKQKFGAYIVQKRRRKNKGLWEYKVMVEGFEQL